MERHKAISKKAFVSEEENNCEEGIIQQHNIELVISIGVNVDVSVNQWRHLLKVYAAETQTKFQMKTLKVPEIEKQSLRGACKNRCAAKRFSAI